VIFPRNPWLDHGPSLSGEVVSSSPNDFEIGSSEIENKSAGGKSGIGWFDKLKQ
jgi:hypothetical protein